MYFKVLAGPHEVEEQARTNQDFCVEVLRGGPGALGENWVERADGRVERLGGGATVQMQPGDAIVVRTPGGGGFGRRGGRLGWLRRRLHVSATRLARFDVERKLEVKSLSQ